MIKARILLFIFSITVLVGTISAGPVLYAEKAATAATAKPTATSKPKPKVTYVLHSPVKNRKIISVFSKNRNGRPHKGTDYKSKSGCLNVYNFYKGTLACKGYERTMGNYVVIKHNVGGKIIYSTYMHLKSSKPISGYIKTGQIIGTMGNTGHSFGVHLHFQIGNSVPRLGSKVTFYNGDKMIANGFTFYNSERILTTKFGILK